jgi:Polyketide cyclase / dehydrase and lipid transport
MALPLRLHEQATIDVAMAPGETFARLDDHRRLAAHMTSPSPVMAGSTLRLETDDRNGQAVGSRIRLSGRVLGIALAVEETVTDYEPPRRKVWQTVGAPRLVVIGAYRMGFDVQPHAGGSQVTLWIDYALPQRGVARWLGRLFGRFYARWCTTRMLDALAPP